MVMCSSLGELTLNFFFGIFGFDLNMERLKENLSEWAAKGGWKGSRRGVEWHIMSYSMPFSFWD